MTHKTYAQVLDASAAEHIPSRVDLTQKVLDQIDHESKSSMPSKMKLATTVLLALLAVLVLSTAVYAVYRMVTDPGMQSVLDAGMQSTVQVTARPTLMPTATPLGTPLPASQIRLSQTQEGITLSIDWVYLDEGRLAFGLGFSDLPTNTQPGAPHVSFTGITSQQALGYTQSIRAVEHQAVYVSYQVIQVDQIGGKLSLGIDVPLVRGSGEQQEQLATFHFDLKDVAVYQGNNLPIRQTYAVRVNGLEVRLKSVRVLPETTEVTACYDFPRPDWLFAMIQNATIQFGDRPEEGFNAYQYMEEVTDDHCVQLGFPVGNADGVDPLVFRVRRIVALQDGPEEKAEGPWEFYVDLPSSRLVPGAVESTPTPTPVPTAIDQQTLDNVDVSLDWVYADVKRIAFGYTILGLPDVPDAVFLKGHLEVRDSQGNVFTSAGYGGQSTVQRVKGEPGAYTGVWSAVLRDPLQTAELGLQMDLTLDGATQSDYSLAVIQRPADATPFPDYLPPGYVLPSVPDRLVGMFHFEATAKVYPMQVLEPKQMVEANGITMRLERAEITPSYARFTLCYNKPSPKDWMLAGMPGAGPVLQAGAYEAQIHGYTLVADADYGGYTGKGSEPAGIPAFNPDERCVTIDFLLGLTGQTRSLTLTVPQLEQSQPEVIPDDELQAAQEKLRAQGIEMQYATSMSAGGGGGANLTYSKLPDGMTEQEAFRRFEEALGYVHPGPWVFEIEVP